MKKIFFILLIIGFSLNSFAQLPYYSTKLKSYLVPAKVINGDTILTVQLREVPIYPKKFKKKKTERFYWKTVCDVKKVYPYVKFIGAEYKRVDAILDTIPDKRVRKKYMKDYEKAIYDKYFPIMKKFTLSQGMLMIRLIDRECGKSSYNLIKQFRGGFVAWWWQVFAKIIGADLKEDFDVEENEKDAIIERVIEQYEAGLL